MRYDGKIMGKINTPNYVYKINTHNDSVNITWNCYT